MIHAFIFDIGNVLLRFDFSRALTRLRAHCDPGAEAVLEDWEPIKIAYESGKIGREEFQKQVKQALRYTGEAPEFVSAWQEIFQENKPMTELVRKLHGRYPLYLLSNTSDLHMDYIFATYPELFGMFSGAVYSHIARCVKPEPEIFQTAIRELRVEPTETVFIDDLTPNVEAASRLGFRAIQYNPDDHTALLAALAREGVETSDDSARDVGLT